jgi:hypothetical protein
MDIPQKNHPNWEKIIIKQSNLVFDCLATKILLGRLHVRFTHNPKVLNECIVELRDYFEKNQSQPKVVSDFNKIFS